MLHLHVLVLPCYGTKLLSFHAPSKLVIRGRTPLSYFTLTIETEYLDDFITVKKCWSSLHSFENSRCYDDKSLELAASNSQTLRICFNVKEDDVFIDSVIIEGLAN